MKLAHNMLANESPATRWRRRGGFTYAIQVRLREACILNGIKPSRGQIPGMSKRRTERILWGSCWRVTLRDLADACATLGLDMLSPDTTTTKQLLTAALELQVHQ
jgi:hypothetical protein